MINTFTRAAIAAAVAGSGFILLAAAPAGASKPTVTAGPGSSVVCSLTATAKLAPTLKNDWTQTTTDLAAVNAIPTTVFSQPGPSTTSAKGSGVCTGSVTDGVNTLQVTGVKVAINNEAGSGSTANATCASLLTGSTALFDSTISFTAVGGKVTPTTVIGSSLSTSLAPLGFEFSGGTISGSFAGGSAVSIGAISTALVSEVTQAAETGADAAAGTYTSLGCQPTLKLKVKNGAVVGATLKAPKGLKKIVVGAGSTLTLSR